MLSVSLVVASYNRAALLPALLKSLEQQTLRPDEFDVIIVDDGSREPVKNVLEKHETSVKITLIEQENQGQAAARHRGIVEAKGDVVVIVDDDMELVPNFLEAHRSWHERGFRVVLGRIRPAKHLERMPLFERFHAQQLDKMVANFHNGGRPRGVHVCTGNVSFRREDYLAVGGFDRNLKRSEDRELGIRLEQAGANFAYAEEAATTHDSDHTSLDVWLTRAYNYGVYDSRINEKHPAVDNSNPWRFFFLVSPISRPFLVVTTLVPEVGKHLARGVMQLSQWLDARGLESVALKGTTLVYGLEYFRGMRTEAGSLRRSGKKLFDYWKSHRKPQAAAE